MTIDKEKIKLDYLKVLNDAYNKIDILTPAQRIKIIEKIKEYNKYLADNGIIYGKLASEVINDEGIYGKVANIYLETQCVFEGMPKEIIPEMREKIIISLAKRDAEMRVEADRSPTDSSYPEIAEYHIDEMKKLKVPAVAWGGLVMEKLIGPGAFGKLYEENAGAMEGMIAILESKKISRDDANMSYSSERLLQGIKHAVKVYHTGIYSDFQPTATAGSKEDAARMYNVDVSRIELIPEANQDMHESMMIPTNAYKIMPAKEFAPTDSSTTIQQEHTQATEAQKTTAASKEATAITLPSIQVTQVLQHAAVPDKKIGTEGEVLEVEINTKDNTTNENEAKEISSNPEQKSQDQQIEAKISSQDDQEIKKDNAPFFNQEEVDRRSKEIHQKQEADRELERIAEHHGMTLNELLSLPGNERFNSASPPSAPINESSVNTTPLLRNEFKLSSIPIQQVGTPSFDITPSTGTTITNLQINQVAPMTTQIAGLISAPTTQIEAGKGIGITNVDIHPGTGGDIQTAILGNVGYGIESNTGTDIN